MKKFIVLLFVLCLVFCTSQCVGMFNNKVFYPEPTGYVVDSSNILSVDDIDKITTICKSLEPKIQLAVVTVKTTKPLTDRDYSIKLAEKFKVGYKGEDNGIIFLIVTEDRRVLIEVGYGAESILNDSKCGRILDESVVPFLKQNKWRDGILSGVNRIYSEVNR